MKHLLFLLVILSGSPGLAADLFHATEASIIASLECKPEQNSGKIISAFKDLSIQKSALTKVGIQYTHEGEEMDERIIITFKTPIQIESSQASKAVFGLGEGNFITYADFKGDPNRFIEKFKLSKIDTDNKDDYISGPVFDPKKDECVPVMRLKKKNKTEFRFGCGWCNG